MTRDRLDLLREADAIVMDGLRRHGLYDEIWQCPTVLVPLELDGEGRELVIVRPIHSERAHDRDAGRACPRRCWTNCAGRSWRCPASAAWRSTSRTKPPGTIEWE